MKTMIFALFLLAGTAQAATLQCTGTIHRNSPDRTSVTITLNGNQALLQFAGARNLEDPMDLAGESATLRLSQDPGEDPAWLRFEGSENFDRDSIVIDVNDHREFQLTILKSDLSQSQLNAHLQFTKIEADPQQEFVFEMICNH